MKCTKFLGITIDEHLDGKVHVDNLSNKIARNVGVLKVKQFPLTNWPYSLDNILYLNHTLLLNAILTK